MYVISYIIVNNQKRKIIVNLIFIKCVCGFEIRMNVSDISDLF